MLLDAGAAPAARDWGNASALDYAYDDVIFEMITARQFPDLATRNAKALEWITQNAGSPYDPTPWYQTPISRALTQREGVYYPPPPPSPPHSRNLYVVERERRTIQRLDTLLRIGADPNGRIRGFGLDATPLSLAIRSKQYRSAAVLLRNGADVNSRWCVSLEYRNYEPVITSDPACTPSNGITPLMFSAAAGDHDAARLLMVFHADRSLKDWAGRTALNYAKDPETRKLIAMP